MIPTAQATPAPHCPLCDHDLVQDFFKTSKLSYYLCPVCQGIFLDPAKRLSPRDEHARYCKHTNNIQDPGYRAFVAPLVEAVIDHVPSTASGLDFGCGPGSALAAMLRERDYTIELYDPYFHNYPEVLTKTYDFVACCEVIEHLYCPLREFSLIQRLLTDQGRLFCMTFLYSPEIDFATWHYRYDPTHVFFYQAATVEWIRQRLGFDSVRIHDRLVIFKL